MLAHAQTTHVPFDVGHASSGYSAKCCPASTTLVVVIHVPPPVQCPAFFDHVISPPVLNVDIREGGVQWEEL